MTEQSKSRDESFTDEELMKLRDYASKGTPIYPEEMVRLIDEYRASRSEIGNNNDAPAPAVTGKGSPALAGTSQQAASPHQWDRDGERCLKCGAKDWMGGGCH
jgi:hypothetical protein